MAGYYNWPTYEFDEERDLNQYFKCWILFGTFCIPAMKPLYFWVFESFNEWGMAAVAERLSVPANMAWVCMAKDGYWYFSPVGIPEDEAKQREPMFREKMTPWIEDFEGIWAKLKNEMMEHCERLKKADLGKLSNVELLDHFQDWLRVLHRSWEIHMDTMFPVYWLYGMFEDMCKELFGIDGNHPQFKALMGGFDNQQFVVNRGLWRLGDRARELGLEQTFQATPDDEELLSKLGESEAGRKWLHEFHEFIQEHGWRVKRLYDVSSPIWIEKPSWALPDIRRSMVGGGVFVLDEERKRLTKEREEAEKDIISRVPADKRDMFEKLMRGAQWCGIWSEDHTYYLDFYAAALGRHVCIEIGRRLARAGVIDEPEDIYFLLPDEIRRPLLVTYRCPMHKTVRIRKEQWQEFLKQEPPLFIGDPSVLPQHVAVNPVLRILAPVPLVRPELKADLYGSGSAPGVTEGVARVVMSDADLPQVQPGEILVAVATTSYWTPFFGFVKGVVTDSGGNLAHAVIVGREYGIPVVAGTTEATKKIKTGDRIRVDGDSCCVYILG